MSGHGQGRRQRVFVALWPTPTVCARLSEVADQLAERAPRARRILPANLHVTLAFVGALEATRVPELAEAIARCAGPAFDWTLDRIGYFGGARVVWAGGSENPALAALAATVRHQLDVLGIDYDPKPFAAHVTLFRGVARWAERRASIEPAIVWPCGRATLVRSEQGSGGVSYVPGITH